MKLCLILLPNSLHALVSSTLIYWWRVSTSSDARLRHCLRRPVSPVFNKFADASLCYRESGLSHCLASDSASPLQPEHTENLGATPMVLLDPHRPETKPMQASTSPCQVLSDSEHEKERSSSTIAAHKKARKQGTILFHRTCMHHSALQPDTLM